MMGFIPESTPEMGEYSIEVRNESFYLRGSNNYCWSRYVGPEDEASGEADEVRDEGGGYQTEISDRDFRPAGGFIYGVEERRYALTLYPSSDAGQGTVEILLEDIPKIRAALDQVEKIVGER